MKKIFISLLIFLLMISSNFVNARTQFFTLNPDPESLPFAIAYDSTANLVFVSDYHFNGFYEIDVKPPITTTYHLDAWGGDVSEPYGVALSNNKAYFSSRTSNIGIYNYVSQALSTISTGPSEGIISYSGYVWLAEFYSGVSYLTKISPITDTIVARYAIPNNWRPNVPFGDGNYIWVSCRSGNAVVRFDITSTLFTSYTGIKSPLGLAADATYVYVAENFKPVTPGETDHISRINKSTGEITRIDLGLPITKEGPYGLYLDSNNDLWWTDNSNHYGYVVTSTLAVTYYTSIYECQYFLIQVAKDIYFVSKGSADIGIAQIRSLSITDVISDITYNIKSKPVLNTLLRDLNQVLSKQPNSQAYNSMLQKYKSDVISLTKSHKIDSAYADKLLDWASVW